jgi:RNA-directed DNA polymerase
MVAWPDMPWKTIHRHVFRLQKRMYRATQQGRVSIARKLQKLVVQSWYARLLAVRRISQDNRGTHTAGLDGVKSLTPTERWRLVNTLRLDSTATPLRRTWIPKRGSAEKRPRGIPCVLDRLLQQALLQGLQWRWDPTFSESSDGFRPGRNAHQAVAQAQAYIAQGFSTVVDLDVEKFFDYAS